MDLFHILAIIITLTAIFSYVNHRYFRLPVTIGVMTISLIFSLILVLLNRVIPGPDKSARLLLDSINFDKVLLHGMLSFLLFAGALNVNLQDLAERPSPFHYSHSILHKIMQTNKPAFLYPTF
ncbi:MAG: hypothetical protein PVG39_14610 [Desulfobacteraceae bacterium]|jgi:CPA1 family monovalent cation:H+ antiporter